MMTLQQKIICIENRRQTIPLAGPATESVSIVSPPPDIKDLGKPVKTDKGWIIEVEAGSRRLTYSPLKVSVEEKGAKTEHSIPSRIFGTREHFLCFTTTTNFHWGHDPGRVAEMEAIGEDWTALFGDPLCFHGHAYSSSRFFAEGVHSKGFPMTWLLDGEVAKAGASEISRWHQTHGDDVGLLPASYFFEGTVNYNTTKTLDQTTAALQATHDAVCRTFAAAGWPLQTQILGVDQWVGSLGTNWIKAAARLGLRGVWGICHDHETCDTSVYHEGAPWEPYRMQPDNFRYPSNDPAHLWAFPWTSRDLCNSFLHYPGSSVWFSTDPDDIKGCAIMDNQPDYWNRLLENHRRSLPHSDFICTVIHNEDHDAHRVWSQNYILNFLDQLPKDSVVPATLQEVLLWLDIRYADGSHPSQLIESADPLTCHDAIHKSLSENQWVKDNWKPHGYWKSKNGHNPSVICSYSQSSRWYAVENEPLPRQYIDYTRPVEFSETGVSPKAKLPTLTGWKETLSSDGKELTVEFSSDIPFTKLPLVFWGKTNVQTDIQTRTSNIVFHDVMAGPNSLRLKLKP